MEPVLTRFDDPDLAAEALATALIYLACEMMAHDKEAAGPAPARLHIWLDANITARRLSDADCRAVLAVVEKAQAPAPQGGS